MVALLFNPASGSGGDPEEVERELRRAGVEVRPFAFGQEDAAVASGADRLVVAGGDGSIAAAAAAAARGGIPLALVPTGTANDFARAVGNPEELEEACRLAAVGTTLRRMELARMDGRPFVNAASVGLATTAAARARPLKRLLGRLAYGVGAVRAGLSAGPLRCRVWCDGEELFAGSAWQVIVACSGAFGGGSRVDVADPQDGRLDATVIEARGRARLVLHAYGLRRGRITEHEGVRHRRAHRVEVEVPPGTPFNVDGELVPHGRATFSVEPRAFQLVTR